MTAVREQRRDVRPERLDRHLDGIIELTRRIYPTSDTCAAMEHPPALGRSEPLPESA